jgi:hypothetical protein
MNDEVSIPISAVCWFKGSKVDSMRKVLIKVESKSPVTSKLKMDRFLKNKTKKPGRWKLMIGRTYAS